MNKDINQYNVMSVFAEVYALVKTKSDSLCFYVGDDVYEAYKEAYWQLMSPVAEFKPYYKNIPIVVVDTKRFNGKWMSKITIILSEKL